MSEKQKTRRWIRKRLAEQVLGLVEPGDHYEAMSAQKSQQRLIGLAQSDPAFAWLKRRLEGKTIKYYESEGW